jgi:hypothetical protein
MNLALPTSRQRFGRFHGQGPRLSGLGVCTPMGFSYSNTPNGACTDGTGSVVDCKAPSCAGAGTGAGGWSSNAPPASTNPAYGDIPIGGFTGTFQVETLDSFLAGLLAAKESPFIANAIARGADSVAAELADFLPTAQSYCAINGALPDCGQMAQLVAKYQALYQAWASGQRASSYQGGDTGTLTSPTNALSNSAPVYTPPPVTKPTNVLNPPAGGGNPTAGQQNVTGNQVPGASTAQSWLEANWFLIAAGVAALVILPQMMKGGR